MPVRHLLGVLPLAPAFSLLKEKCVCVFLLSHWLQAAEQPSLPASGQSVCAAVYSPKPPAALGVLWKCGVRTLCREPTTGIMEGSGAAPSA